MAGMVSVLSGGLQDQMVQSWQFLFARIALLFCVVLVYWVLVNSLEEIRKQTILQEQLNFETHLMELQMDEQQKHNRLMMEHEEQLRRQRHDLRHQLAVIRQLADTDPARLKEYVASLLEAIPVAPRTYCKNPAVHAIVSYYISRLENEDVDTRVRLELPQRLEGVPDGELCIIFGNLLENAMEACSRMAQGPKFVHLDGSVRSGVLTVTMDNSFDGRVTRENGAYRSSKRSDLGVGLASIQAVAQKHRGNARFEPDGTVFRSSVYLQI